MAAAKIEIGVIGVPGPTSDRGLDPTSADDIATIVAAHPGRFIGFGSVEPSDVNAAVNRIGELADAGLRVVTTTMSSLLGPYMDDCRPEYADRVATDFPLLQDQLLFGSVYPNCGPLSDLRQIVSSWSLPPTVEAKYLRHNAERVLGL